MFTLTLKGNTYGIKEALKGLGFRWDAMAKAWKADFEAEAEAQEIASRWTGEGVTGSIEKKVEKRYFVKEDWIFNLESMHDKIWCLTEDVREGKIALPFTVAGKTINSEDDLDELADEAHGAICCYR